MQGEGGVARLVVIEEEVEVVIDGVGLWRAL